MVIICLIFIKPKKYASKNLNQYSNQIQIERLIGDLLSTLNAQIDRYNQINQKYQIKMNEVRELIYQTNDSIALEQLDYTMHQFNEKREIVMNLLTDSKSIIGTRNLQKIKDLSDQCEEAIKKMEQSAQLIYKIHPQKQIHNTYSQQANKESASNLEFFQGCVTRTNADKRFKALSRALHPDNDYGNEDLFKKMKEEYDHLSIS